MLEQFIEQLHIVEKELQAELREKALITHHRKGAVIIKNRQFIKVLKIVLKGKVRVYQENENREILIYYLNDLETCTLSLSACFEDCQSTVNAIVEEESTILNIPVRFVRDWNFKYRSWNNFTLRIYRESYQVLLESYSKLAFKPLKDRLLEYLMEESYDSILKRSHEQISKELGTTREVVSRLLKKLELDGKVKLGQKEIRICI